MAVAPKRQLEPGRYSAFLFGVLVKERWAAVAVTEMQAGAELRLLSGSAMGL